MPRIHSLSRLVSLCTMLCTLPNPLSAREPWRPHFHFTPAQNWMNDPNGMVFHDGEWHLFYQYNPFGDQWGHMSWGHAVSRDLLNWDHLPVALKEENGIMIFSGSAVVDEKNTSGFGKNGAAPMVAIYTAHTSENQSQAIAYSNDRGRTWTKYEQNPVIDIGKKDFRDPKVIWHEPTQLWIMTIALPTERKIQFYASRNLKNWELLDEFGPAGSITGIWECPDLFPLPIEGESGKSKWVLIVSVPDGAPGGGCGGQYFIGNFDGRTFTADPESPASAPLWLDYGPDFYAAVTWSQVPREDGRRILLGWMSNWQYANDVPTKPWRNTMSLPRELTLHSHPGGYRIHQKPIREFGKPADNAKTFDGGTINEANAWLRKESISGNSLDLSFSTTPDQSLVIDVLSDEQGEHFTRITLDPSQQKLSLDRTRSGIQSFNDRFPRKVEAPLPSPASGKRDFRIIVDACSVEIFTGNGELSLTSLAFPPPNAGKIRFSGEGWLGQLNVRIPDFPSLRKPADPH